MADNGKIILRSGGGMVVFFTILILFFTGSFFFIIHEGQGRNSEWSYLCCLVFIAGIPVYLVYFMMAQKIELDERWLRVSQLFGNRLRPEQWAIRLDEIDEVVLADIRHLKKNHELMKSSALRDVIDRCERKSGNGNYYNWGQAIAAQFEPLIVVHARDSANTRAIITKPFSRKGGRALMAAFRKWGVKVAGDEKL